MAVPEDLAKRLRRRTLVTMIAPIRQAISTPAPTARPTTSERSSRPGSAGLAIARVLTAGAA
jgi:hypothetical protein